MNVYYSCERKRRLIAMRMTHEADYAIRVVYCLAEAGEKVSAKDISERTGVSLRFALKILDRKSVV